MAVRLTYRLLLIAVMAVAIAILFLGVLLSLGLMALVAALVFKMNAKWRYALFVVAVILIGSALFRMLF
jgi:hypothetical protein